MIAARNESPGIEIGGIAQEFGQEGEDDGGDGGAGDGAEAPQDNHNDDVETLLEREFAGR